jgi:hypothetical protein
MKLCEGRSKNKNTQPGRQAGRPPGRHTNTQAGSRLAEILLSITNRNKNSEILASRHVYM